MQCQRDLSAGPLLQGSGLKPRRGEEEGLERKHFVEGSFTEYFISRRLLRRISAAREQIDDCKLYKHPTIEQRARMRSKSGRSWRLSLWWSDMLYPPFLFRESLSFAYCPSFIKIQTGARAAERAPQSRADGKAGPIWHIQAYMCF